MVYLIATQKASVECKKEFCKASGIMENIKFIKEYFLRNIYSARGYN